MDSGNSSGSMQSSSGGDEEYDSRSDSVSAFLNANPTNHLPSHLGGHGHGQLQHQHMVAGGLHSSAPTNMFDPLSNFFDPQLAARSANSPILNLDMAAVWSKGPRPDPSSINLGGFGLAPMHLQPSLLGYDGRAGGSGAGASSNFSVLSEPEAGLKLLGSISGSAPNDQHHQVNATASNGASGNPPTKNPKKRSRASRRAPTTVLTTDTTNFRAMVQEFTGIPAPPFTAPPFQRSRLDLFGSASGAPSYFLRPFAQKMQLPAVPPFGGAPPSSASSNSSSSSPFPTSIMDALASSTAAGNNSIATDLGLLKPPPPGFLNQTVQNPILDFQSLFQAPPKYPIAGSSISQAAKPLGSSDIQGNDHSSHMRIGMLDEFGLRHEQVSTQLQTGVPNLGSAGRTLSESNNNNDDNPPMNWHGDGAGSNMDGTNQGLLRPLGSNFGRVGTGGRGPGNGGTRGEGMVESWID